jgi:uncharacterized paraquat-inducible protein A
LLPHGLGNSYLCPHCGAPVGGAALAWKSNQNAATLAILSELVLAIAVFLPFMSVVKLGDAETYSLVGGIGQLWQQGEVALAMILGSFSLVFPLLKNAFLVAATTSLWPLTTAHRRALHSFAAKTGKYSMLGDSTEVAVRSGIFLFCLAIALSMAASWCVQLGEAHDH